MAEEEEEISFEEQLKLEELERRKRDGTLTKKDPDGTIYEWDDDKKAWFPKVEKKVFHRSYCFLKCTINNLKFSGNIDRRKLKFYNNDNHAERTNERIN